MDAFADLPDALVRDLLAKAEPLALEVSGKLNDLLSRKSELRERAVARNLVRRKADLDVPREPSVAAIDGSYQVHHLTAVDLCAVAAIAVEGTSKEARRYWPEPRHDMYVETTPHAIDSVASLRGLMMAMETSLAFQAPHDLVLLDGSFSSIVIYLNQALTKIHECPAILAQAFSAKWRAGALNNFFGILESDRFVALPKFTSRNEVVSKLEIELPFQVDGKSLATLILEPGEYIEPLSILGEGETYHLNSSRGGNHEKIVVTDREEEQMNNLLKGVKALYFRPYGWLPAVRIEVPAGVANSPGKLSIVLDGIMRQFFSPAVFEPYPLFLADRMVKSLGSGVAVIEQALVQEIVSQSQNVETSMLFLQNYRTEGGRGGV